MLINSSVRKLNRINGLSNLAIKLVDAMKALVMRDDLELLTMLTWSNVITSRNLLRDLAAWCPFCFQEWKSKGQTIYSPLIWNLNIVKICKYHNTYLHNECLECKQTMQVFSSSTRVGYCSKCGEWLGLPLNRAANALPQNMDWELWVCENIGKLIAATPFLKVRPQKNTISNNLRFITMQTLGKKKLNIALLSRLTNERINTMSNWCNGRSTPSLESLLKICYCLDISLLPFLTEELLVLNLSNAPRDLQNLLPKPKKQLQEPKALDVIEKQLNEIISSNEYPPPSLAEVSRRIGVSNKFLKKHFPKLYQLIVENFLKAIKDNKTAKVHMLCQEVREATIELHRKGIYPSRRKVEELCTLKGINLYKGVNEAWIKTKTELGYD